MKKRILVTGISGFIAKHVAREFLDAGYAVRGSLRSLDKADAVRSTLQAEASSLDFAEADLNEERGWDDAAADCFGVAHVASPFPLGHVEDEDELIRPAVDGTLRVLSAARKANVNRFVQTSSQVAVMHGHPRQKIHFDETDWTQLDGPHLTAYQKSKTLAEQAARDFVAGDNEMHFSTVNPGVVWGPALDSDIGASLSIVQMLLEGRYPGCPKLAFPVVDVRDVAKMHRLALESDRPSGGRYFAVADTPWLVESSRALKSGLGDKARKAPRRELPDFVVRLVGLFDPVVRATLPDLGWKPEIDTTATRNALGIDFIDPESAVIAAGESLLKLGLVTN